MKTNRERAQEVLRRVNDQKNESNKIVQPQPSNKNKIFKLVAVCMSAIIVCVTLGVVIPFVKGKPETLNLDKTYIANFENYTAIGAGVETDVASGISGERTVSMTVANSSNTGARLIGIDKNGKAERIKYKKHKDDNDDESEEIVYVLRAMCVFEKYTIVSFVDASHHLPFLEGNSNVFDAYNGEQVYLIDNSCGKFYSLNGYYDGYVISYNIGLFAEWSESDDAIYFIGFKYAYDAMYGTEKAAICKAYVENDILVIKEMTEPYKAGLSIEYFVDRYGNIFLEDNNRKYQYMVDDEGKLSRLDDFYYRALNGIAYGRHSATCINEKGEVVSSSLKESSMAFSQEELLKREDNCEYYLQDYKLYKVEWIDEVRFNITTLYESAEKLMCAAAGEYVYFCEDLSIFRVEIVTGQKSLLPLEEPMFFTSIKSDNLGNVLFEALDSHQNKVNGMIDNEGHIFKDVTPSKFEVYYIRPLN